MRHCKKSKLICVCAVYVITCIKVLDTPDSGPFFLDVCLFHYIITAK